MSIVKPNFGTTSSKAGPQRHLILVNYILYILNDLHTKSIKASLFISNVESVLLYRCEAWTLAKQLEKQLDGCFIRMLRTVMGVQGFRCYHFIKAGRPDLFPCRPDLISPKTAALTSIFQIRTVHF